MDGSKFAEAVRTVLVVVIYPAMVIGDSYLEAFWPLWLRAVLYVSIGVVVYPIWNVLAGRAPLARSAVRMPIVVITTALIVFGLDEVGAGFAPLWRRIVLYGLIGVPLAFFPMLSKSARSAGGI